MAQESVSSYASQGGKARAEKLSPEQLSEIGRRAVEARWEKEGKAPLPKAMWSGPLNIGGIEFESAVLEDRKTRVISETNFMEAMGMYRSGALSVRRKENESGAQLPLSLAFKNLKPYIEKHLGGVHYEPLKYRTKTGGIGHGIRGEVLPKICEIWLDAKKDGVLGVRQEQVAEKAEILIRGLAYVGIIALIDEATGFQYDRARQSLQDYLKEFLSESLRRWVKTFPNAYFKELCRLKGVDYRTDMKLPQYFGHYTNDIVYRRLGPSVLEELKKRNKDESGRKIGKHHQWLSEDVGNPQLLQHLGLVVGLMKISEDWDIFKKRLDMAAPPFGDLPLLAPLLEDS